MAAKLGGSDDGVIVDINITPFVDIVLVILIIFMVTSVAIVRKAIKVDLPDAAAGESTEQISLGLIIDEHLQWYLDGEPTTAATLRTTLSQQVARAEAGGWEVVCLVSADTVVPYGEVIRLVDLVKTQGVSRFALDIDPIMFTTEVELEAGGQEPGGTTP